MARGQRTAKKKNINKKAELKEKKNQKKKMGSVEAESPPEKKPKVEEDAVILKEVIKAVAEKKENAKPITDKTDTKENENTNGTINVEEEKKADDAAPSVEKDSKPVAKKEKKVKEVKKVENSEPILDKDGKPLSKRALKKLKKREGFADWKIKKRAEEKLKKKKKNRERAEKGEQRKGPSKKVLKQNSMEKSACKLQVVYDSSFDDVMEEKEVNSYVLQIQHAYSANRRAANPLQFYVTSNSGPSKSRLDSVGDSKGWDVNFEESHYLEKFSKEDVVYLSGDSPNVLETLDDSKVYIIGGLVDHNKHKGLCHEKAEEAGVTHARLPIGEYIKLDTRKVLACNHVFEILLRYTELKDWEKAFFQVIPKRKQPKTKADKKAEKKADKKAKKQKAESDGQTETKVEEIETKAESESGSED